MIPQSFIQDLLARVDIVEVIDRHVKLKRAGANHVACCPFHSEKTPSFTVSPVKQFYHCFGCGAHGTAVGFLMEHSGMGFVEAVKELAQSVGMKVPEEPRSETEQRRAEHGVTLYEVLLQAAQHYRGRLKDAPQAIAYLKQRGLSGDIAKRFGIGYAPDEWQGLAAAFSDYNGQALPEAGLVKTSDEGRRYDVFRNRIMFPIVDVRGNVIGFGGRVLGEGEPKYLNSPETPVFEKGRELYGLYQARRAIRDAGRVLVVEGYMDVVALAQAGVEYAVATLGTATTPLHVQKLLRQADEIVFSFDGDAAGRKAAWRALENSLSQLTDGKQIRFLFLPEGEDPDTYVRKHGKSGFEQRIAEAIPLSELLKQELLGRVDIRTAEGRAKLLQDAKPLVKQIAAPMTSLLLRQEFARIAGITTQDIEREFQIKVQAVKAPKARVAPPGTSYLRNLVELLLLDSKLAGRADRKDIERAIGLDGIDQTHARLLSALLEACRDGSGVVNVLEYFRGTEFETPLTRIQTEFLVRPESAARGESQFSPEELGQQFDEMWRVLREEIKRAQYQLLRAKLEKQGMQGLTAEEQAIYVEMLKSSKGRPAKGKEANVR